MSSPNILFILGAGASIPYNFPTGMQLREKILNEYIPLIYWIRKNHDEDQKLSDILNIYKKSPERIDNLVRQMPGYENQYQFFKAFKSTFGTTIDRFITGRGSQFIDQGRFAIASAILKYENESYFHKNPVIENDWMSSLFHNFILQDIFTFNDLENLFNINLNFLTFNYDRTLEYFISSLFPNLFRPGKEMLLRIYKHFRVHHIYGKIGTPENNNYWRIDYGKIDDPYYFYQASQNINIMYNNRSQDEDAIKLISDADIIFILGFGFDPFNLQVIDFPYSFKGKHVYATCYKMSNFNKKRVLKTAKNTITNFIFDDILPIQLLDDYWGIF